MTPPVPSSIAVSGGAWLWIAVVAAVVLVPLAWLAVRPAGRATRTVAVSLALRLLGIGLLLLCLLDPQLVTPRPKRGANLLAVVADNSQSLQVSDAGATVSRGGQVHAALTGDGSRWLATLAENFQVRAYAFDHDLRRVSDFSTLDFSGDSSALGAALRRLRERFAGQPLAGIVLFTDGNATDLPNGLGDTAGLPPIYPVVVGKAEGLQDVRIARADPRQTAFDDAPVSLRAEVSGLGMTGRDLTVGVRALNAPAPKAGESAGLPAPQTVRLHAEGEAVSVAFDFKPRGTGVQFYEVGVDPAGPNPLKEATTLNNRRVVAVDRGRPAYRILYVGGRPDWEFKFLNRALSDDPQLQLVGLIRVAPREPKFSFLGRTGETSNPLFRGFGAGDDTQRYDQPVLIRVNARDEKELAAGFPRAAEELFAYDAVILDDVEAAFFSQDQLLLLRRFAAERGGGLLMLGGPDSLGAGGYDSTPVANALPVYLDRLRSAPAPADDATYTWSLTREGWLEPWTRVRAQESDERERLKSMPAFNTSSPLSAIKPGATILANVTDQTGKTFPALVAQNFGAGRVAALGVGGMWLWGMHGEAEQADLARFWRQLARWLVTDVPAPVELRIEPATDNAGVSLAVTARDGEFRPLDVGAARVTITRIATEPAKPAATGVAGAADTAPQPPATPVFTRITLPAEPVPDAPGQFAAAFAPREAGAYLAEVEVTDKAGKVLGKSQAGWVNDPAAEEFSSLVPNRALLEELARRTGGQIIDWTKLSELPSLLSARPAPITETESHSLWNQSWVFLAVLACFLTEWGWRRWRGLP